MNSAVVVVSGAAVDGADVNWFGRGAKRKQDCKCSVCDRTALALGRSNGVWRASMEGVAMSGKGAAIDSVKTSSVPSESGDG